MTNRDVTVRATAIPVNPKEVILPARRVLHRVHTIHVSYVTREKRYYSIKEKAISIFFNDVMETTENENS